MEKRIAINMLMVALDGLQEAGILFDCFRWDENLDAWSLRVSDKFAAEVLPELDCISFSNIKEDPIYEVVTGKLQFKLPENPYKYSLKLTQNDLDDMIDRLSYLYELGRSTRADEDFMDRLQDLDDS